MFSDKKLKQTLSTIDGKGYKAYKQISGEHFFTTHILYIDHVQGDPFAQPSKVRLRVNKEQSKFPKDIWKNNVRKIALEDFIARAIRNTIQDFVGPQKGSGKSGLIYIDAGRQEVLDRTAVVISENWIEARIQVGLPANGRKILGRQAIEIFFNELPHIVENALYWENINQGDCHSFVYCVENQESIRKQLGDLKITTFIANGSVLPRKSGVSDLPLSGEAVVPFQSPQSLEVTVEITNPLSNAKTQIKGMGIPNGITLIVGGGYHGKSTLLKSIERCVYPHIPGDGREYVITRIDAVKIRSEEGRRVEKVNITSFISNLPQGISTDSFCSGDASGSTSQAANIIEALEVGADLLLLDEDTSAANFMVRDARMQKLVHKDNEPITPFVDRVREIYDKFGVSTILVMGGSGDYFEAADTIIKMQDYTPNDVGDSVTEIVKNLPTQRKAESPKVFTKPTNRSPQKKSFDASRGRRQVKIDIKSHDLLIYGKNTIDLRYSDQLVDPSQTGAIGYAIFYATQKIMNDILTIKNVVDEIEKLFNENSLDLLDPYYQKEKHPGNFSRPRKYEIAAAINRIRTGQFTQNQ